MIDPLAVFYLVFSALLVRRFLLTSRNLEYHPKIKPTFNDEKFFRRLLLTVKSVVRVIYKKNYYKCAIKNVFIIFFSRKRKKRMKKFLKWKRKKCVQLC